MTKSAFKLCLSALAILGLTAANAATTLSGNSAANNANIAAAYGSNLAGTPNIALTWSPVNPTGNVSFEGWQAYTDGGWTNASAINTTGTGVYQMGNGVVGVNYDILFTPDAGYAVTLSQLDINVYTGGGTFVMTAQILDSLNNVLVATSGGSILNDASFTKSAPVGNSTWNFTDFTGATGQALKLRLNVTTAGTGGGYLAMDNLVFDQVSAIPEPSTYGLLGAGALGVTALIRRRRKVA